MRNWEISVIILLTFLCWRAEGTVLCISKSAKMQTASKGRLQGKKERGADRQILNQIWKFGRKKFLSFLFCNLVCLGNYINRIARHLLKILWISQKRWITFLRKRWWQNTLHQALAQRTPQSHLQRNKCYLRWPWTVWGQGTHPLIRCSEAIRKNWNFHCWISSKVKMYSWKRRKSAWS